MKVLKLLTASALGLLAYKAWQRYQDGPATTALPDDRATTPPHGDPLVKREPLVDRPTYDVSSEARAGAQSSRGFGAV